MSYTRTLCSTAPISKVKTAYHCNETLSSWTNLATHRPSNYIPYRPDHSYSRTNLPGESRTRKAKPSPIKPYLELPPTLQIGQPTPQANTTISTPSSHRSTTPSSSPHLHLNIHSTPTTPQADLFKPLPSIKIVPCVPRKPVTPPTQSSPSPDLLQAFPSPPTKPLSISPPSSPSPSITSSSSSSSPPTPSISPISLSPSLPSPKYGDARFHTLPEEAYPLITVSHESKAQHDSLSSEQERGTAAAIDDYERPFWRAAIQPVIDPRSGMNYYGQAVWG